MTTAFQLSQNVTIHLPISIELAETIKREALYELRIRLASTNLRSPHKTSDIEAIMRKLGISTINGSDYLTYYVQDDQCLTVAGELLVKHCQFYDHHDYGVKRVAAVEAASNEVLVHLGDGSMQWIGVAPAARTLPDQVAEYIHIYVSRHYDTWVHELMAPPRVATIVWRTRKSKELETLGLSDTEIEGWWDLHCRREWSAKRWAKFCRKYSNRKSASGLLWAMYFSAACYHFTIKGLKKNDY